MSADTHACAVAGCEVKILRGLLMCKRHWRLVPRDLAAEVNDSYRALHGAESVAEGLDTVDRYRAARSTAVAAVESREAAP